VAQQPFHPDPVACGGFVHGGRQMAPSGRRSPLL
jgi:hypothetical protein